MFENTDASYDGIDFEVLGNPDLEKVGSKEVFEIDTSLNQLIIKARNVSSTINTISANEIRWKSATIGAGLYGANQGIFDIDNCYISVFVTIKSIDNIFDNAIVPNLKVNINSVTVLPAAFNDNISFFSNSTQPGIFNVKINNFIQDTKGRINISTHGIYNIDCLNYDSPDNVLIVTAANQVVNLTGKYKSDTNAINATGGLGSLNLKNVTLESGSECIIADVPTTFNTTGTLTMITAADPKVGANVTLNNIIDVPSAESGGYIIRDVTAFSAGQALDFTDFDFAKPIFFNASWDGTGGNEEVTFLFINGVIGFGISQVITNSPGFELTVSYFWANGFDSGYIFQVVGAESGLPKKLVMFQY